MKTKKFRTDELEEWGYYYDRLDSKGTYHSPEYLDILEGDFEFEGETAELFILEDGDDFVYYPYLIRSLTTAPFADETDVDLSGYYDIVSSWYWGGPLLSKNADQELAEVFKEEFSNYCADSGIVAEFIRFDPNLKNYRDFECLNPEFNRKTVPVDLTQSKDEIWEGYEKRNKNAIRQAQDTKLEVKPTSEKEDYEDFQKIYSNAMEAKDASDHYRFELDFFVKLLDSPYSTLLVAEYENEVVGGSIVVHDDETAYDYLRASKTEYWDMRVNNLVCHEALMHMHDTGRSLFDFQGGRPGVFKFKKGFSPGRSEMYIGSRTHMPEKYDEFVEIARTIGINTNKNYFPAYRVEKS